MSKLLPASVVFVAVVIIVVDDVTKETVGSPVTTNCIVTRKLRDYGTRVNHRETVHVRVAAVARAREKGETEQALGKGGGRTKRGRGGGRKGRETETRKTKTRIREKGVGGGRGENSWNNYCLYFQIVARTALESSNCSRHWIFIARDWFAAISLRALSAQVFERRARMGSIPARWSLNAGFPTNRPGNLSKRVRNVFLRRRDSLFSDIWFYFGESGDSRILLVTAVLCTLSGCICYRSNRLL